MPTLKERLDMVWQHKEIACCCHIVIWREVKVIGHTKYGGSRFSEYNLWYWKGKRHPLKVKRK